MLPGDRPPHGQYQLENRFDSLFDLVQMVTSSCGNVQMDIAVARMAEGVDLHPVGSGQGRQLLDELGNAADRHHHILGNIEPGLLLDPQRNLAAHLPHLSPFVGIWSQEDVDRLVCQAYFSHSFDFALNNAGSTVGFDEQKRFALLDAGKREKVAHQFQALVVHEFEG